MRRVPLTMTSNIFRGSSEFNLSLASVAAWMTCVNLQLGNTKLRISPCTKLRQSDAKCGAEARKRSGSRLRNVSRASSSCALLKCKSFQPAIGQEIRFRLSKTGGHLEAVLGYHPTESGSSPDHLNSRVVVVELNLTSKTVPPRLIDG